MNFTWGCGPTGFGLGLWYNAGYGIFTLCIGPLSFHWKRKTWSVFHGPPGFATYIRLKKGTVDNTEEVIDGELFVDYDKDGQMLGIEVLSTPA